ncbi:PAS domain S-box protein [Agrobacterium tumefaciens]|uniref:PAS domain S-box protein n=1 Tax=Agrobacterium tumefaciens TaxID=358 RepID=UPI0023401413|nr:PAS domain S-box protein [Agrobacterium tumefaciens]WCK05649.1 PAS domain S-box protein [Agrobacterium tumefaciens]
MRDYNRDDDNRMFPSDTVRALSSDVSNGDLTSRDFLQVSPIAGYLTDEAGTLIFYNELAADIWQLKPRLKDVRYCGSLRLHTPDGEPLPHAESPMAIALREKRPVRDHHLLVERPDGSRLPVRAFATPIFNSGGVLSGGVNMLIEEPDDPFTDEITQRMTAIIQSSDDAILAKDLNGIITDWNRGAEQLFGYTVEEAVGRSVTMLIPPDRADEEPAILARLRRGEKIDHYETVRKRKDGTFVDISLSVSPIRNRIGHVIGASKIARDITERRRAEEQQHLLIQEMNHRVKNLFTVASSIVSLSARTTKTSAELAAAVRERLNALSRAHMLTVSLTSLESDRLAQATTLHSLIKTILAPYGQGAASHVIISGPDIDITGGSLTSFALLLHEFATNAAKYGALSTEQGRVEIACESDDQLFTLTWTEKGGPPVKRTSDGEGFGTILGRATIGSQLGGEIHRDWKPNGLVIRLSAARDRL